MGRHAMTAHTPATGTPILPAFLSAAPCSDLTALMVHSFAYELIFLAVLCSSLVSSGAPTYGGCGCDGFSASAGAGGRAAEALSEVKPCTRH
jgi:hypothetical protein